MITSKFLSFPPPVVLVITLFYCERIASYLHPAKKNVGVFSKKAKLFL